MATLYLGIGIDGEGVRSYGVALYADSLPEADALIAEHRPELASGLWTIGEAEEFTEAEFPEHWRAEALAGTGPVYFIDLGRNYTWTGPGPTWGRYTI